MKDVAARWATWAADTDFIERWALGDFEKVATRWIIWAALDGYTEPLTQRLRKGLASREEMAFAADLIDRKVKPRRPGRGQPTRFTNDQIAQFVFQFRVAYPDWPKKKIIGEAVDAFGVKKSHVYNVLKALDSESRKRHEENARYAVSAYASNATELAHFMFQHKIPRK
jgi:hypothetical protein